MVANPVLGLGPGNFPIAEGTLSAIAARQQFGIGVRWNAAHNSYVQIGAELGFPGLVLYLAVIASAFQALRRSADLAPALTASLLHSTMATPVRPFLPTGARFSCRACRRPITRCGPILHAAASQCGFFQPPNSSGDSPRARTASLQWNWHIQVDSSSE